MEELLDQQGLDIPVSRRYAQFVAEYLIDLDAEQAALRTGYLAHQGEDLLAHPEVARALAKAKAERERALRVKAENALLEMSYLAFSDVSHYRVSPDGYLELAPGAPSTAMRAVASIKRKVTVKEDREGTTWTYYELEYKLWDKPNAIRLMGRHCGLFSERLELTGKDGAPVEVARVERIVVDPDARQLTD